MSVLVDPAPGLAAVEGVAQAHGCRGKAAVGQAIDQQHAVKLHIGQQVAGHIKHAAQQHRQPAVAPYGTS